VLGFRVMGLGFMVRRLRAQDLWLGLEVRV